MQIAGDEQVTFGEGNLAFGENVTVDLGHEPLAVGTAGTAAARCSLRQRDVARALASLRLRREIAQPHREQPYDLIYQFSSIETPGVPASLGAHRFRS